MDIVIDQANSYSMGMNGVYALARGKIVLSGAEPEAARFLGLTPDQIPVINIRPEAEQIHRCLVDLIASPERLLEIKKRSRDFLEQFHDADHIAQMYVNVYDDILDRKKRVAHPALDLPTALAPHTKQQERPCPR